MVWKSCIRQSFQKMECKWFGNHVFDKVFKKWTNLTTMIKPNHMALVEKRLTGELFTVF